MVALGIVALNSIKSDTPLLSPKSLYKFLFRRCDKLPTKDIQNHYKHSIRQAYGQHADETDSDRIKQIIVQAVKDSDWILKKYNVNDASKKPSTSTQRRDGL